MIKKLKDNFLVIYLIFNIVYLYGMTTLCSVSKNITYKLFGQSIIIFLIFNIIISIILTIKKYKKEKNLKKLINIYNILIIILIVLGLITSILAINKEVAFFGHTKRYEGFFAISNYLILIYLSSFIKKEDRKKIIYAIIIAGVYEAIFAYLQVLDISFVPKYKQPNNGKIWRTGSISNPNFLGTFMLLSLSSAIGLFIDSNKRESKLILITPIIILIFGLLLSNTTSTYVGLIFMLIYLAVFCLKNKKIRSFTIIILIIILETSAVNKLKLTEVVRDLKKTRSEVIEISKGNYNKSYGTNRMEIWERTLKKFPKYAIHGIGIDNYFYLFGSKPLIVDHQIIDKAHNEYLQILVTQGILTLIGYLSLFGIITINGIKNSFKEKETFLILPIIGYLVQAFFNISVLEVAPVFYIILGLSISKSIKNIEKKKLK